MDSESSTSDSESENVSVPDLDSLLLNPYRDDPVLDTESVTRYQNSPKESTSEEITSDSIECLKNLLSSIKDETKTYALTLDHSISQSDYEALSASILGRNLTSLTINAEHDDDCPVINTSTMTFPKLAGIDLTSQALESFYFKKDQFPALKGVSINQPGYRDLSTFELDLPLLTNLSAEFITIEDDRKFGASISKSPLLESIFFYKVWGLGRSRRHVLVCPNAEIIDLYRSDDLRGLSIWAPKLTELNLQACFGMEECNFFDEIPMFKNKKGYEFDGNLSEFKVNILNSGLGPEMFEGNPRVKKIINDEADAMDNCTVM